MEEPAQEAPARFARVQAAAIFDRRLCAEALRVLAALGTYADREGRCYPAVSTLAKRLQVTRRSVQRHLTVLREAGYLTVEGRRLTRHGAGTNQFRLTDATPGVAGDATPHVAGDATPGVAQTRPVEQDQGNQRASFGEGCRGEPFARSHRPRDEALRLLQQLSVARPTDLLGETGFPDETKLAIIRQVMRESPASVGPKFRPAYRFRLKRRTLHLVSAA